MEMYDGSYQDLSKRLIDDDLVSLKLLYDASKMLKHFGETLEKIEKFGHSHGHGHGYTCANMAAEALEMK